MDRLGETERQIAERATRARFETHAVPHLDSVYRTALMLSANEAEAEDLTQETFARALASFDRFELRDFGRSLGCCGFCTTCSARPKVASGARQRCLTTSISIILPMS